jgi:hypothetical protein
MKKFKSVSGLYAFIADLASKGMYQTAAIADAMGEELLDMRMKANRELRDELGATGQRLWTVERVVQERERREGGERQKTKE